MPRGFYRVLSKPSTHPVIVPQVAGEKNARAIERLSHDAQRVRIIDRLDPARRIHVRSFSTGLRKSCRASQMREVSLLARNIDEAEIRSRDPDHRRSPICGSRMEGLPAKIICCKIGFFMPMNWSFGDTERPEIPARSVLFYSEGCSGIIASRDVGLDTLSR